VEEGSGSRENVSNMGGMERKRGSPL